MSRDCLEKGLERLKEKRTDAFGPPEAFKREFFERARHEAPAGKNGWTGTRPFRVATAAAVLLAFGSLVVVEMVSENGQPAAGLDSRCSRFVKEAPDRLRETVSLFEEQVGVGYIGDEIFTFSRQSGERPDRILRLSVFDRNMTPRGEFELAFSGNDFAAIDTQALRGEIVTTKASDGSDVLDANLLLRLPDGRELQLSELVVGAGPDSARVTKLNGLRIRRELVRI